MMTPIFRVACWLVEVLSGKSRAPRRSPDDVQALLARLDRRLDNLEKELAAARKND